MLSIADVNHMKYYWGKLNGSNSGTGQELIMLGRILRGQLNHLV